MKRRKSITRLSTLILICEAALFGQSGHLYVKPEVENIRKMPNGSKTGEVLAGTEVEVLERSGSWVKVQLTGWMQENSLTNDSTLVWGFRIRASHILLETEEEANRVLTQLRKGADFEQLAEKISKDRASGIKGGDIGEFERGEFVPEFENVAFHLKVGEISGVTKSKLGYHIIKRTK
jgi:hypothetical protein